MVWYSVGGLLCLIYGQKISSQLKSGRKEADSPQLKRIKRMCRLSVLLSTFGFLVKMSGVGQRAFKTNFNVPACAGTISDAIPVFIFIIQYTLTYIFQPMYNGKKMSTHYAMKVSSQFKSTNKGTTGRTSQSRGTTKNTTGTSGKSGTTSASGTTTASGKSGSASSSKQSSNWFSSGQNSR